MKLPLFESLLGSWQGQCRTWFEPGELADESPLEGRFEPVLGGHLIRHTYSGEIQNRPRKGEETIAFNSIVQQFQMSWLDDFHMSDGILFSTGMPTADGFNVRGDYEVGPDQPAWGWKTVYALADNRQLSITAYNVTPEGHEAKAVEVIYRRQDR